MFDQALNMSVYMTITFVLFLLGTFFLIWTVVLMQPGYLCQSYNRWVSSVIFLPNFMILSVTRGEGGGGGVSISNLLRSSRRRAGSECFRLLQRGEEESWKTSNWALCNGVTYHKNETSKFPILVIINLQEFQSGKIDSYSCFVGKTKNFHGSLSFYVVK